MKIALLPGDCISRAEYIAQQELPDNYMSDFTLLGFTVDRFDDALALLDSGGYRTERVAEGADVYLKDRNSLFEIRDLFSKNSIDCSFTDVADTLYQA